MGFGEIYLVPRGFGTWGHDFEMQIVKLRENYRKERVRRLPLFWEASKWWESKKGEIYRPTTLVWGPEFCSSAQALRDSVISSMEQGE